ncbi:MAG: hypothetical protein U0175_06800 [Caldilineaceae bacterium]
MNTLNTLTLALYCDIRSRLAQINNEEDGAEAIEWIAMVAVILILLLAVEPLFKQGGTTIGGEIIAAVSKWIKKFV